MTQVQDRGIGRHSTLNAKDHTHIRTQQNQGEHEGHAEKKKQRPFDKTPDGIFRCSEHICRGGGREAEAGTQADETDTRTP